MRRRAEHAVCTVTASRTRVVRGERLPYNPLRTAKPRPVRRHGPAAVRRKSMPWSNQGGGPWGSGPKGPWGSGPQSSGPTPPDLEDLLRRSQDKLKSVLPGGNLGSKGFALIGLAVLAIWGFSGFFRVETDEIGVVMRFG